MTLRDELERMKRCEPIERQMRQELRAVVGGRTLDEVGAIAAAVSERREAGLLAQITELEAELARVQMDYAAALLRIAELGADRRGFGP